jgi:hypothetical protein
MKSKSTLLLVGFVLMYLGAIAQPKTRLTITVSDPGNKARLSTEIVSIKWAEIVSKYPGIKSGEFKLLNVTGEELPYQLEYFGGNTIQNLLVQTNILKGKALIIKLIKGKPAPVIAKVYGRYVPERKDDFAWENDQIAFRMYGKALEGTNENAYGMDVWAKRTNKLIVDNWYKTGDYHADHGDGLDYYSVGLTLGAGDIAPYVNDQIAFPKNYRTYKILDHGPLRFSFQLEYEEWLAFGTKVRVQKKYTLDAGSQMNKVEATFTFSNHENMLPVATGIVKRKEKGEFSLDPANGIIGYWEPEHGADGILGIGTIMINPLVKQSETNIHLLQGTTAKNGVPVIFYSGAAWNKAGTITNAQQWFDYLQTFKSTISSALNIKIK